MLNKILTSLVVVLAILVVNSSASKGMFTYDFSRVSSASRTELQRKVTRGFEAGTTWASMYICSTMPKRCNLLSYTNPTGEFAQIYATDLCILVRKGHSASRTVCYHVIFNHVSFYKFTGRLWNIFRCLWNLALCINVQSQCVKTLANQFFSIATFFFIWYIVLTN